MTFIVLHAGSRILHCLKMHKRLFGAASSTLASYTWMADGAKYASARADGSGYVYKGALVFERNAAGKLSLDAALTTGGRIIAQKDASTAAITGYTVHHHITDKRVSFSQRILKLANGINLLLIVSMNY